MAALTLATDAGAETLPPKHLHWINFLACVMIFSEGVRFGETAVGEIRLGYALVFPMLVALMFFLKGVYMSLPFTLAMVVLGAASFWNVLQGKDTYLLMVKQLAGVYANSALFFMILKLADWDVRPLFRMYLTFAVIVAGFGVFQEFAFLVGMRAVYNLGWVIPKYGVFIGDGGLLRIHSLLSEPSCLGLVLIPASLVAVLSLRKHDASLLSPIQSAVIIAAIVFTFSTLAYLGVLIGLLLLMINFGKAKYVVSILILVPALGVLAYTASTEIRKRVDDSIGYLWGGGELEKVNVSSFAIFTNMHVANRSFAENPLIGSGLGSHPVSFGRHIGNVVDLERTQLLLNKEDANSLFLRLISETGLLGLGLMLWYMFRFRLPMSKDPTGILWIINNGIFAYMVVRMIRFGHYFDMGHFFYFWAYYFSYRKALNAGPTPGTNRNR